MNKRLIGQVREEANMLRIQRNNGQATIVEYIQYVCNKVAQTCRANDIQYLHIAYTNYYNDKCTIVNIVDFV